MKSKRPAQKSKSTDPLSQSMAARALVTKDPKDKSAAEQAEEVSLKTQFERYIKPSLEQYHIEAYYAFISLLEKSGRGTVSSSFSISEMGASSAFRPADPTNRVARAAGWRRIEQILSNLSDSDEKCLAMMIAAKSPKDIGKALDGYESANSASASGLARIKCCLENLAPHVGAANARSRGAWR